MKKLVLFSLCLILFTVSASAEPLYAFMSKSMDSWTITEGETSIRTLVYPYEIGNGQFSNLVLFQNYFGYFGSLEFPYEF